MATTYAASVSTSSSTHVNPPGRKTTILVYGATSFTGPLVIEYLLQHRDRESFDVILGGRSVIKLTKLVDGLNIRNEVEIAACALEDTVEGRRKVDEMVAKCDAVINLAGPYSSHNAHLLIRSCASSPYPNSKHYVDLTGETPFIRSMIDTFDHLAWTNRSCIVPSCGFDSIPSDSTAYLSARKLATDLAALGRSGARAKEGILDADVVSSKTFFNAKGGASGGTIASGFALMEMDPLERSRGMEEFALTKSMRGVSSGGPKLVYSDSSLAMFGSIFVMGMVNTAVVRRTWYLLQNARPGFVRKTAPPRSTSDTDHSKTPTSFTYGTAFTYEESLTIAKRGRKGSYLSSAVYSVVTAFVGLAFQTSSLFRWCLKKVLPKPGEGPTREAMMKGYSDTTNISTTSGGHQAVSMMSIEGDPAYLITTQMLVESALALTLDNDRLPDLGREGGVLTPMTAMGDRLIERLERTGKIRYTTSSVEEWKELTARRRKDA